MKQVYQLFFFALFCALALGASATTESTKEVKWKYIPLPLYSEYSSQYDYENCEVMVKRTGGAYFTTSFTEGEITKTEMIYVNSEGKVIRSSDFEDRHHGFKEVCGEAVKSLAAQNPSIRPYVDKALK